MLCISGYKLLGGTGNNVMVSPGPCPVSERLAKCLSRKNFCLHSD